MWIVKKINNNCALARDTSGQDVVVFGRGIGFRHIPYELTDLSLIDRTFYGVRSSSVAALKDIPEDIVFLASDVIEHARDVLGVDLNLNAPITLADHINFAIGRARDGMDLSTPLAFDVRHLYPKEYAIGKHAVTIVKSRMGVELPESECTSVALHIIDAESERSDLDVTKATAETVDAVTRMIEESLGSQLDTDSFQFSRFVMHLSFLVGRMLSGERHEDKMSEMLDVMRAAYPEAARLAGRVMDYFDVRGWSCDQSEELYLLIHIQRLM